MKNTDEKLAAFNSDELMKRLLDEKSKLREVIENLSASNDNNNGVIDITMRDAWNHFTRINVNQWLERKGDYDYLKWQVAWYLVKEVDPTASFHFTPMATNQEVECVITVLGQTRKMHLPVLNFANKPIDNPTSFDINTAKMRCMVKGLAVFYGLGFYVYFGFNSPEELIQIGDGASGAIESLSVGTTVSPSVKNVSPSNSGSSSAPNVSTGNGSGLSRTLPLPPVGGKA